MFRITQFMKTLMDPENPQRLGKPPGPVVIWNLIRRCNLCCKHCYSISADKDFPGELSTEEVFKVMDNLKSFRVPALILSGGEPLLRPDIFEIGQYAKKLGFYVGLSTNGTLIEEHHIQPLLDTGFDYVGISIDGIGATHDEFRQMEGAYDKSMAGVRLCQSNGIKVGLRFTLTQENAQDLPELLKIVDEENIDKFYLSHLNYAGRGDRNREGDVVHKLTRWAMDLLFDRCWEELKNGKEVEYVTGNNDADGVYLLYWVRKNMPELEPMIKEKLERWGGNSSGVNVANIDNLGNVHPDTFWWNYNLGNVKDRPFSEIWKDTSDPLMAGLKQNPRTLKGRCGECKYQKICGGNTRVRAYSLTGDAWQEDPACYLTDEEIGVDSHLQRLTVTPYSRKTAPAPAGKVV